MRQIAAPAMAASYFQHIQADSPLRLLVNVAALLVKILAVVVFVVLIMIGVAVIAHMLCSCNLAALAACGLLASAIVLTGSRSAHLS